MNTTFMNIAKSITTTSEEECLSFIEQAMLENREFKIVSFVNAHGANLACKNQKFYEHLVKSNLLLRDGVGIELLMKRLGLAPGPNLNGTDLIPELLKIAKRHQKKVAIFGTNQETINNAEHYLKSLGIDLVISHHGFDTPDHYVSLCNKHNPELIILGMGMPKQEALAFYLHQHIQPAVIVNGGAIFDFIAGRVKRAPVLFRKLRIEWLFRLLQEPKRLFKRYVLGNVAFLWRCI